MRPYNHPDNVAQNGQPKMSEDAWLLFEQARDDKNTAKFEADNVKSQVEMLNSDIGLVHDLVGQQATAKAGEAVKLDVNNIKSQVEMLNSGLGLIQDLVEQQAIAKVGESVKLDVNNIKSQVEMLNSGLGLVQDLVGQQSIAKSNKVSAVVSGNAVDLATALTLVNELKAKLDLMNA